MSRIYRYCLLLIVIFPAKRNLSAQDSAKVFIRNIFIEGNKKTKESILLRELTFSINDSIPGQKMNEELEKSRQNLQNLNIFGKIEFNIKNWENDSLDVLISVNERGHWMPVPIFQFADRNINVWWVQQHHDFKRIQAGAMVYYKNAFGLNHTIIGGATFGFSQIYLLEYRVPYFNANKTLGGNFRFSFSQSKQVPIRTINNEQEFFEDTHFIRKTLEVGSKLAYRGKLHNTHFFITNYFHYVIDDTVAKINPDFFLNGQTGADYFQLGYAYEADYRNFKFYPTDGWYMKAEFEKDGFGILKNPVNFTKVTFTFNKFFVLDKKSKHFSSHSMKFMVSGPKAQPYFLQKALGYKQDFIRSYEYSLIDGQRYLLFKNDYKYKLVDTKLSYIKKLKGTKLGYMPISLYLTAHFDAGAVRDVYYLEGNDLRNKMLYGWGVGVNIVMFYDRVLRFEYSFDDQLRNGFFIHFDQPL